MNPTTGKNERDLLKAQVKSQRFHIAAQYAIFAIALVILLIVIVRERTLVVPPGGEKSYEVGPDYGDKGYLLDMSELVLSKLGNITPENVEHNNKVLLRLADSEGRADLKTQLDAAAIKVKREQISTIWAPEKEEVQVEDKRVITTGRLKTYIADKRTSDVEKTYVVEFKISMSGRASLLKAVELVKGGPSGKLVEQPSS